MDHPSLVALVSVLAILAAVGTLGVTALLAGAYTSQRERLRAAEKRVKQLEDERAEFDRVRRNKLYQGAMQEYGFAARQSIIRLRALEAEIDSEFHVIEKMLNLTPKE